MHSIVRMFIISFGGKLVGHFLFSSSSFFLGEKRDSLIFSVPCKAASTIGYSFS